MRLCTFFVSLDFDKLIADHFAYHLTAPFNGIRDASRIKSDSAPSHRFGMTYCTLSVVVGVPTAITGMLSRPPP
jgi:hypothetical protein